MSIKRLHPMEWYCPATSHQTGERCGQGQGAGTDHPGIGCCRWHGGASPSYRKKAERIMAEQAVARLGLRVEIDPLRALLDEVARAHAAVLYIEAQLADIAPERLVTGTKYVRRTVTPDGESTVSEAGAMINAWVEMWHRERTLLRQASAEAIKAGAIDRQLSLAEEQGELMGRMLRAVIDVLPLDARPAAYAAARAQLSLVRGEIAS